MATWSDLPGGGYRHSNGAVLAKSGKSWVLTEAGGKRHTLPKRASFDHAERILMRSAARPHAGAAANENGRGRRRAGSKVAASSAGS